MYEKILLKELSLKRGFDRCGHGLGGFDGFDRLGGLGGLDGFSGFDGLSGFDGFSGFDGLGGFDGFSGFDGLGRFDGFSGFDGLGGFNDSVDSTDLADSDLDCLNPHLDCLGYFYLGYFYYY